MVSVTIGNQTHKRNQHTKENSPEMSTTAIEIPGYLAGTWKIDPVHSDVAFTVRHMMVSKVRGHFTRFEGELVLAPDPYGGTRAGFSGTAEISRHDFGITTEIPMDGGGVVVGDKIQIFIEIEAVLAEPHPAG